MSLVAATGFLTRLPVASRSLDAAARSQGWFPLVGLGIGALLVGIDRACGQALPVASVDVVLVFALAGITGGLHLDGLADTADGLAGGGTREQRLVIMRDTHTGSFGVIAIVGVLALKWAGLNALPPGVRTEAILITPCLGRFAMLLATYGTKPARSGGLYATFRAHVGLTTALSGAAIAVTASLVLFNASGALPLLFAACCAAVAGAIGVRLVGGMTGDLCGATAETTEALALLFIAATASRGWMSAVAFH